MKILIKAALVFTGIGVSAAHAQSFKCEMYSQGNGGWVGEEMYFSLVPEISGGAVLDFVIQDTYKHPLPATVTKRKDHIWRYKWKVKGAQSSNSGKANLSYTAMLNTQTGALNVNGFLSGADNNISGAGVCKVIK